MGKGKRRNKVDARSYVAMVARKLDESVLPIYTSIWDLFIHSVIEVKTIDIQWHVYYSILLYFQHHYVVGNLSMPEDEQLVAAVEDQLQICKQKLHLTNPRYVFLPEIAKRLAYVVNICICIYT